MDDLDYLESYHPSRLTVEEACNLVEEARHGTSVITDVPVFRADTTFKEDIEDSEWRFFAAAIRPYRREIKVLTLEGGFKWISDVFSYPRKRTGDYQLLPPHLSTVPYDEIVAYITRQYIQRRYNIDLNVTDIHEYLRPVSDLSANFPEFSVYDETQDRIISDVELSKVVTASYRTYIEREYGITIHSPTVFRKREWMLPGIARRPAFEEIIKMSYAALTKSEGINHPMLHNRAVVRMVEGDMDRVVVSTVFGERKEMGVDFNDMRSYLLHMDGTKLRILDDGQRIVRHYRVVVSALERIVLVNISPLA